jgi:hypothetical protein
LIGLPIRLTISERALDQGGVEMKLRNKPEKSIIRMNDLAGGIRSELVLLHAEINASVLPVEYND